MRANPIKLNSTHAAFTDEVQQRADTVLKACLHCLGCSNICPFASAMDYNPNALLRLVQLGMRPEALASSTIWICVGCHTCSSTCPMAIDIPAIMDTLRSMALEEDIEPAEPEIVDFHRQVLGSIQRHGRAHKLEIMLRHKLQAGGWFSDLDLGLRMLAKRKLDLRPSKVKNLEEVKKLFTRSWQK